MSSHCSINKKSKHVPDTSNRWYAGSIYLKNIKTTMPLPYPMRAKYGNVSDIKNYNYHNTNTKNRKIKTIDFIIEHSEISDAFRKFENGCSEGRIMDLTGNLQKLLKIAEELGYSFDFYPSWKARYSDRISRKIYKGNWNGPEILSSWNKPYFEREQLASIGGLIALHKSEFAKNSLLKKISEGIKIGNGYDVRQFLKRK